MENHEQMIKTMMVIGLVIVIIEIIFLCYNIYFFSEKVRGNNVLALIFNFILLAAAILAMVGAFAAPRTHKVLGVVFSVFFLVVIVWNIFYAFSTDVTAGGNTLSVILNIILLILAVIYFILLIVGINRYKKIAAQVAKENGMVPQMEPQMEVYSEQYYSKPMYSQY